MRDEKKLWERSEVENQIKTTHLCEKVKRLDECLNDFLYKYYCINKQLETFVKQCVTDFKKIFKRGYYLLKK